MIIRSVVPQPPGHRTGAQSVERALDVLRCFETVSGDLGVTEIAARTGLTVSTSHRLTRALCTYGLVVQDARTERYRLGPTVVLLGRRAAQDLGYALALPQLEDLSADTGESVNLGISSAAEVLVVLHVPSPQPLHVSQEPGSRLPAHASAMGKCLLAFAAYPTADLHNAPELPRFTERTLTDAVSLAADLDRTRARGWALNDEERNPGVRAVAAPVLDRAGGAVAAVAVQGPTVRLTDAELPELAARAIRTAQALAPLLTAPPWGGAEAELAAARRRIAELEAELTNMRPVD